MKKEKKLYRSNTDYVISGVCGGLAEYFGIDAIIIRIIFIMFALAGGGGLIIYILMVLLLPNYGENENDLTKEIKSKVKNVASEIKKEVKIKRDGGRTILGLIVFMIGSILLWNHFFPYTIRFEVFWPSMMVVFGLWMILKK